MINLSYLRYIISYFKRIYDIIKKIYFVFIKELISFAMRIYLGKWCTLILKIKYE